MEGIVGKEDTALRVRRQSISENCPLWSPDGKKLYYLSADNYVMTVSVKTEPDLSIGTLEHLFPNTNLSLILGRGYPWGIHPDVNRFLMIKESKSTEKESLKINIIANSIEELKDRVPTD